MQPTPQLIRQLRRDKIEAARRMTPEQKLLAGGELFDVVVERMLAGIRMQFPDLGDDLVRGKLQERLAIARRLENRS